MKDIELWQGDCLELMKDIPDGSVDLVVTDPPYLHVKGGMKSKKFNVGKVYASDSHMNTAMSDFGECQIYEFLDLSLKKLKKANLYVYCSKLQLQYYFKYISEHKKLKYDLLIWDKIDNRMMSTKFYMSDIEYIVRIYEPGISLNKVWNKDVTKADYRYYKKLQSFEKPNGKHTTMKPLEMLERFVMTSSDIDDIVLDPFMGSGTTGIACRNLNRKFIGIELDETYFNLAKERIESAEGLNE